ncbi:MAG: heavy metal translocating P-type ATPase [Tissierellia bacterium]|nr:heavy metal translocating P-type ATPase [Tissierellia bacterium]
MKSEFDIRGMTCSACSQHVEKAVSNLEAVTKVSVNLLSNTMNVEYDGDKINELDIIDAVDKAGYQAISRDKKTLVSKDNSDDEISKENKDMKFRLIVSFLFMIPLMYIAMGDMVGLPVPNIFKGPENSVIFAFTQMLMTLPIIYVNRKYYINGFKSLIRKSPNMDSLIAIGSSAAFLYGLFVIYKLAFGLGHGYQDIVHKYMHSLYFESAAMILALITLGKYLEAKSKGKTTDAIKKLMDLSPKKAIRLEDGREVEIDIEEVRLGDILVVRPGSSIPVDGKVVDGKGSVDTSAITGESIPVEVFEGDEVIGSTILQLGSLKIEAEKIGEDTTLSKIIKLVQDANATKAPISKLADKIAAIFVPVVISISILATIIWLITGSGFEFALTIGISILVISCPCALGLATPVAIMVGTGKGASNGILIKSAEALETLHEVGAIVLDKTGTITIGRPEVTDIINMSEKSDEEFIAIAKAIESPSEHPLSLAIKNLDRGDDKELKVKNFTNHLGKGIEGTIDGILYHAGNLSYMKELKIDLLLAENKAEKLSNEGKTVLYFSDSHKILGLIAVADKIKKSSSKAVDYLHEEGISVYMLTGDNEKTAAAIANELKLDDVMAEVLPQDKEEMVRKTKEGGISVAMVGDGINDAPALARADVGIAIGAGTDIAIEAADIVLMKSDLLDVVNAIDLSKQTIKNIKQNLFWAFFYNILCIPLAAGVFYKPFGIMLNPMIASAAMSLSSLFVVTNALRLNRFKPIAKIDSHEDMQFKKEILKEETKMKKVFKIEGMSCSHCSGRVTQVLNDFDNVNAIVDLDNAKADVEMPEDMDVDILKKAIEDAGYSVISIEDAKA